MTAQAPIVADHSVRVPLSPPLRTARALALVIPALLLAGAWYSQLVWHLYPCEMCHWQRWPHYAAVVVALLAFAVPRRARPLTFLAGLLVGLSGIIGLYHAGTEWHWWGGLTACTSTAVMTGTSADDRLAAIMAAPIVRCDVAQWRLFGISLAGYNALISLVAAFAVLALARKRA